MACAATDTEPKNFGPKIFSRRPRRGRGKLLKKFDFTRHAKDSTWRGRPTLSKKFPPPQVFLNRGRVTSARWLSIVPLDGAKRALAAFDVVGAFVRGESTSLAGGAPGRDAPPANQNFCSGLTSSPGSGVARVRRDLPRGACGACFFRSTPRFYLRLGHFLKTTHPNSSM